MGRDLLRPLALLPFSCALICACNTNQPLSIQAPGPQASGDCEGADGDGDLKDDNCNGLVDEDTLTEGAVVITELMVDPLVPENHGEYLELFNATGAIRDLAGCELQERVTEESFVFPPGSLVDGEGFLVLGRTTDSTASGGVKPDIIYEGLELENGVALQLRLRCGPQVLHDLNLQPDELFESREGRAVSFDPTQPLEALGDEAFWCAATSSLSAQGQTGTPGKRNDLCRNVDHDGDGFPSDDGDPLTVDDCDDGDAVRNPSAVEIEADGIDQDCDGKDPSASKTVDDDGDGFSEEAGDCDDTNTAINPKMDEICGDGIDQDCDDSDLECSEDVDNDSDGYTENQGDCNDSVSTISPAGNEICGDGIDQDCDKSDAICPEFVDDDQDGYSEKQGDCDDTNAEVYPAGGDDVLDGSDNDCDGLVDEHRMAEGDLLITEVMRNPLATSDSLGEYVEIFNHTERPIDLKGLEVVDLGDGERLAIESSVLVQAESYVVVGHSMDTKVNGGVNVAYVGADLILQNAGTLMLALEHAGELIEAQSFPETDAGVAWQVDRDFMVDFHTDPGFWCAASSSIITGGDRGTPGKSNDLCGGLDHDGDSIIMMQDCNDSVASIHPNAEEVCGDGIDQDCDKQDKSCSLDMDDDKDGVTENQGDCDDAVPTIHPGAKDLCGDGIDQDCQGGDAVCREAQDQDGDGYSPSLLDCNDADAAVYPGAPDKELDHIDNNCDGMLDEEYREQGDILFTEVMRDPVLVSDSRGEYIELYNATERVISLNGLVIEDESDGERLMISEPTYMLAQSYLVLGRSDDKAANGGVPVDVVYENLILENAGSLSLALKDDDLILDSLHVDDLIPVGTSWQVDPFYLGAGQAAPATWCPAVSSISEGGDSGSPGKPNDLCAALDHDGDGINFADDCNDFFSSIFPGAEERCGDGIDQDCDGLDASCSRDMDDDKDGVTENQGDCDDTDPNIRPGAMDLCGDGIDQDCHGGDIICQESLDLDADGYSQKLGDCNDADPLINPGAPDDLLDRIDNNCNGLQDEEYREPGDLLFSEIMRDPDSVSDSLGEYIELYNTTERVIALQGLVLQDETDDELIEIGSPIFLLAQSYVVLGRAEDPLTNGGVPVDYVYENLILENTGTITLTLWDAGLELDSITRQDETPGVALVLDRTLLDGAASDRPEAWCQADTAMSGGDMGSPGKANNTCQGQDRDGDGFTNLHGDCDDANKAVSPAAQEVCDDGIDNDCSGGDLDCALIQDCKDGLPTCPDEDEDGDGLSPLGGDCDDTNPSVYAGAADPPQDFWDLLDNDCDGLVDEDLIKVGDIIFTEIMKNPPGVPNTDGEWFEVFNDTERDIDLKGWRIKDVLGHEITLAESLVVGAGWQVVLGVNQDKATNGGIPVDYRYQGLVLPNDGDGSLTLSVMDLMIDQVTWNDDLNDNPGRSLQLSFGEEDDLINDLSDDPWVWCHPSDAGQPTCTYLSPTPGNWNHRCGSCW